MKGTRTASALVVILLAASIVMAGCTAPISPQKPRVQTRTAEEDAPVGTSISLQDALEALRSPDAGGMVKAGTYSIYDVYGEGIDPSGRAKDWIIAVKADNSQFYFQYGSNGANKKYNWTEPRPGPAVAMDRVLMPEDVVAVHRSLFQDALSGPGNIRSELELSGGIYTLTVEKGGAVWEYAFNAETGGLVENRKF